MDGEARLEVWVMVCVWGGGHLAAGCWLLSDVLDARRDAATEAQSHRRYMIHSKPNAWTAPPPLSPGDGRYCKHGQGPSLSPLPPTCPSRRPSLHAWTGTLALPSLSSPFLSQLTVLTACMSTDRAATSHAVSTCAPSSPVWCSSCEGLRSDAAHGPQARMRQLRVMQRHAGSREPGNLMHGLLTPHARIRYVAMHVSPFPPTHPMHGPLLLPCMRPAPGVP
eukprot:353241-Chlamydomonas_euryale.AAC.3